MTYHKKGLKLQSSAVFHWVLKREKKERGEEWEWMGGQGKKEPNTFILSCGLDS